MAMTIKTARWGLAVILRTLAELEITALYFPARAHYLRR